VALLRGPLYPAADTTQGPAGLISHICGTVMEEAPLSLFTDLLPDILSRTRGPNSDKGSVHSLQSHTLTAISAVYPSAELMMGVLVGNTRPIPYRHHSIR
jgi:hypothetical protein